MALLNRDLKITDTRFLQTTSASLNNVSGDYGSTDNMRTRLAAINSAYFTTAMLNTMTINDMRYAIRLADDPTSF